MGDAPRHVIVARQSALLAGSAPCWEQGLYSSGDESRRRGEALRCADLARVFLLGDEESAMSAFGSLLLPEV